MGIRDCYKNEKTERHSLFLMSRVENYKKQIELNGDWT